MVLSPFESYLPYQGDSDLKIQQSMAFNIKCTVFNHLSTTSTWKVSPVLVFHSLCLKVEMLFLRCGKISPHLSKPHTDLSIGSIGHLLCQSASKFSCPQHKSIHRSLYFTISIQMVCSTIAVFYVGSCKEY